MENKYQDKPLLLLIESFVLKCIGHLPDSKKLTLEKIEPKLRMLFNKKGTWDEIVTLEMAFPDNICESIMRSWEKNSEIARQSGAYLSPEEFAVRFVAANFEKDLT